MSRPERGPMEAGPSGGAPWLEAAYILLLLGAVFAINFGRQLSGDVYWHLRTGEWIVKHHTFPWSDPFSYTATKQWILQEWGFQVFAWLISRISFALLTWVCFAMVAGALVITYATARARASAAAAFLVTLLAAGVSADMVDVRPNVAGVLAFAILVWGIEKGQRSGKGLPYWLLILFVVWANVHSSFTAGLALLAVECLTGLQTALGRAGTPDRFSRLVRDAGVTAACAALALINPNGLRLYEFPLRTVQHTGMTSTIAEWASPDFRSLSGASLCVLILLLMWTLYRRERPIRPAEGARIGVFLVAALTARRLGPFFALATVPIAASLIAPRVDSALRSRAASTVALMLVVILTLTGVGLRISEIDGRGVFEHVTTGEVFPESACDFVLREEPPGPMFNELNYGSYLIWRLWPKYKVFIDNRNDIFYDGAFEDFMRAAMVGGNQVWRRVFDKYGVNLVIIMPDTLLADVLTEAPGWQRVYQDDKAVIFTRRAPVTGTSS